MRMTALQADRRFDLLAVGDPVLDVVVHSKALPHWDDKHLASSARQFAGGCESNAACAASRLGLRAAVFGQIGGGPEAAFLHAELLRFGVSDAYLQCVADGSSATALIYVGETGERAITYVPATGGRERGSELMVALKEAVFVYAMPYDIDGFERMAAIARSVGTLVATDIERAVAAQPGAMPALIAGTDLMFFNEAGFHAATGLAPTLDCIADFLCGTAASVVVVSMGARGAIAVSATGERATQRAFRADVKDTTGAGDTFNAAFIASYLKGTGLQDALTQGCAAACLCIESVGARSSMPEMAQVDEVRRLRPMLPTTGV